MGKRKNVNTTLDEDLYQEIQILALNLKTKANDLIEEGMRHVVDKYTKNKIINNVAAAEQAVASLKISGFEFDMESIKMWEQVSSGELTTQDARKLLHKKINKMRIEHPEFFVEPDK